MKKNKNYIIPGLIIINIFIILILFTFLISQVFKDLDNFGYKKLKRTEKIINKSNNILSQIQHYDLLKSKDRLKKIRIKLYESDDLKDIVFFENNKIIETAILGKLKKPQIKDSENLTSKNNKYKIWLTHESIYNGETSKNILIKYKDFGVVLNNDPIKNFSQYYNYEITYLNNDDYHYFFGKKNIFKNISEIKNIDFFYKKIKSNYYNYYLGIQINTLDIIKKYSNYITFITMLIFFSLIITFNFYRQYLKKITSINHRIKNGLINNNFYFLYQPIFKLEDQSIIGVEVLARFEDQYGKIYPNEFIKILQNENLTWKFTKYLFKKIPYELKKLNSQNLTISINIFPSDILNNKISSLRLKDFHGYKINLEIIEEEFLKKEETKKTIDKLKNKGFGFAIDDFGTGYSNFNTLNGLPIDYIKIDKSFIWDLEKNIIKMKLVKSIIQMANSLNIECIAEGIENNKQLEILKNMNIKNGQGYFHSKPMTIENLVNLSL